VDLIYKAKQLQRALCQPSGDGRVGLQVIKLRDDVLFNQQWQEIVKRYSAVVMTNDVARSIGVVKPSLRVRDP